MKRRQPPGDLVGLELGSGLGRGMPAVRLRRRAGVVELLRAGFLQLPHSLPVDERSAAAPPPWRLPGEFRAPGAALALSSPQAFFRPVADGGPAEQPGYRQVMRETAPDMPPFAAGVPEWQAAWAARLLPEGSRPTACSLQIAATARLGCFARSPHLRDSDGCAVAIFVNAVDTVIAALLNHKLLLYREHPLGNEHVLDAVGAGLRIPREMARSALNGGLIDPTPVVEPLLQPLVRQVEISADYLGRRRRAPLTTLQVYGVDNGRDCWSGIFSRAASRSLVFCSPLDGLRYDDRATDGAASGSASLFTVAIGAALMALEDA